MSVQASTILNRSRGSPTMAADVVSEIGISGQNDRIAFSRLAQEGVEVATVSEFRSPDYPTDSIVAQDPASGTRAPQVSLLLNRGEQAATYVMPDVIGMHGERAAEALRRLGFRVTIVGEHPYPGVPPGTVLRQHPSGGFQVGAFDAISLEVSAAPEQPGVGP